MNATCHQPLTAFRVYYSDGTSRVTNMATGITLAEAQQHFVGKTFEIIETTSHTATEVVQLPHCSDCKEAFDQKDDGNPNETRCAECQVQFRLTKKTAHQRYLDQLRAAQ